MGRSKRRRNKELLISKQDENLIENTDLPFANVTTKYLLMRVNSGTKMKNVLGYAIDNFSNYKYIIWTGIGQAVNKVISCSEIFKIKHPGLHQINKLRYIITKNKTTEENRTVPEIHILLSKEAQDTTEPGYQAPDDPGQFNLQENTNSTEPDINLDLDKSYTLEDDSDSNLINIDLEIPPAAELKSRKTQNKNQLTSSIPSKKRKMKENN